MPIPSDYSFSHYLAAKKSVDDRALNRHVWESLAQVLAQGQPSAGPIRLLEVGGGIGTMLERMLERGLLRQADYTLLDAMPENIHAAGERLQAWATAHGWGAHPLAGGLLLQGPGSGERPSIALHLVTGDVFEFIRRRPSPPWDLLVANAFLDLVDIPAALPQIFSLLRPGGLFYFSLNFDGVTLFEPPIDPALDADIVALYHHSMDERLVAGKPSGDSRTGRRLFAHLRAAGAEILDAGASDWVVFPGPLGYPAGEAYFLHFILHFFESSLRSHPELDAQQFAAWLARRHAQVEAGELVYIAHQLDFLGKISF